MSTPAELLKHYKQMATITYALYVPPLVFWLGLLVRVLIYRDRLKFSELIIICVLMIIS